MAKKFKVKKRNNLRDYLWFSLRIIKRKPNIVYLEGKPMPQKCLMIANHNGASGPFNYRTFLPKMFMTWGAHPMTEGFLSRWRYLRYVFYEKKLKYSPFKSGMLATGFGLLAGSVYKMAAVIPVYYDQRMKKTFEYSMQVFEENLSVLVFPENSNEGYEEFISEFFSGYLTLSKLYYRRYKEDLPIYTLYITKKKKGIKRKKIIVGKPMYLQELLKEHTFEEVNDIFRNYMNSLTTVYQEMVDKGEIEDVDKKKKASR